ncbi:MAG: hypothetical protein JJU13_16850 [Balneolaceae bacterium]|nr:hypothetical protein [Balneolaceae bacterium]
MNLILKSLTYLKAKSFGRSLGQLSEFITENGLAEMELQVIAQSQGYNIRIILIFIWNDVETDTLNNTAIRMNQKSMLIPKCTN